MNLESYQFGYKDAFVDVKNILGKSKSFDEFKKSFDAVKERVNP